MSAGGQGCRSSRPPPRIACSKRGRRPAAWCCCRERGRAGLPLEQAAAAHRLLESKQTTDGVVMLP
ncbi:hypothetical protein WK31_18520 [Burkholderia vietnamiensis]|nr:hypothetical protein WK31_18520 [Burkholderia vietnamiensis]